MSIKTEFLVTKRSVGFMSVALEGSIFVWVGEKKRLDVLCFAQLFRQMTLIESSTPNHYIDSFSIKLNKLFPDKQVYFSTDLSNDDPEFWAELLQNVKNYVDQNKEYFGVD